MGPLSQFHREACSVTLHVVHCKELAVGAVASGQAYHVKGPLSVVYKTGFERGRNFTTPSS